jgi:hypothetical protein
VLGDPPSGDDSEITVANTSEAEKSATVVMLSFAKTLQGHKSRPVSMLQARPHAIHFKPILDFGEGQPLDCLSAGGVPFSGGVLLSPGAPPFASKGGLT